MKRSSFEVEHTTSIYLGIVRLPDLANGAGLGREAPLFLVAPDKREKEVKEQLLRPAFKNAVQELNLRFLPFGGT